MILGIGVDIIEISRIKKAIDRNQMFLQKLFTDNELDQFKNHNMKTESIAGKFASKEAVSKALGTGFRNFSFKDIEIINNDKGKPQVYLHNGALDVVNNTQKYKIHLSISHNKTSAIAYALLEVF